MSTPFNGRRQDPTPMVRGGELAVLALTAIALGAALVALAALGVASWAFGGGWVWPHGSPQIVATLASLPTEHPGRGLAAEQERLVPSPTAVRAVLVVLEAAYLATCGLVAVLIARYRRPGDVRGGMATRSEAGAVLGVRQLRKAAAVVRPDLHRQRRTGPGRRPS